LKSCSVCNLWITWILLLRMLLLLLLRCSALHPDMRKDWAAGWARLLAPGAELATIIFPVGPGEP
jgi:hypothetical protein